jgi:short subunit dehydrogenase-like uncharacterized protein
MLYGAYGHTGTLIAEEAVRRGHRPLLAGRSQAPLAALADRLKLDYLTTDRESETFKQAVADVDLVLQAAGPFEQTTEPVVQACLAGGTHYMDIANEVPIFQLLRSYDEAARERGIALMTGAGFGVIPTDCLVKFVADQVPGATSVEAAIVLYSSASSAGATKSGLEMLRAGGLVWRDGKLVHQVIGTGAKQVRFPDGVHTLIPAPFGELEAIHMTTAIPNITVYSSALPSGLVSRTVLPLLGQLLNIAPLRRLLERTLDQQARRSSGKESHTESGKSYIWARAVDAAGKDAQAWLEMGEGYLFSAAASVRAVEQLLASQPVGTITPARAFGADFVLSIAGTNRYTTLSV